jgi:alpha-beta hydrolase superfamily lysophospholipase
MEHLQYYFKSSQNKNISAHIWKPDGNAKAIVLICHGIAEHIKRYDRFAEYLAKHQILSCGIDLPGHGDSSQDGLGFFSDKDGCMYIIDCILELKKDIIKKYPNIPVIIFGHSMGAFIAQYIAAYRSEGFDMFIFCGSSGPVGTLKFGKMLALIESKTRGTKHVSGLLNKLSFTSYNKSFKPNRTDFDWLSRDTSQVDKYVADDKCGFVSTCSGYYDLFYVLDKITSKKWPKTLDKNKHYLFISGDDDPVGQFGKGVLKIYARMKKNNVSDVEIKLYYNARHELLNEINYEEVYEHIINFINKRLTKVGNK